MRRLKAGKVLNIISIIVFVVLLIISSYMIIDYFNSDKNSGSVFVVLVVVYFNIFNIAIVTLLSVTNIIITSINYKYYNDEEKKKYKKQFLVCFSTFLCSILFNILSLLLFNI